MSRRRIGRSLWHRRLDEGANVSALACLGEELMSHAKSFGLAILAALSLLGEGTGSAHAQCAPAPGYPTCATEWSGGSVINLGGGVNAVAISINNAGQAVGYNGEALEWSGGAVITLGSLPGSSGSQALAINDFGQAVGSSFGVSGDFATEWSGGQEPKRGHATRAKSPDCFHPPAQSPLVTCVLKARRYGLRKRVAHAAHACRHKPAFGPDQAHVSYYAFHKIIENRGDVGMREFIGQRDFGEEADSKAGQNAGSDRLDAVG
jgi:hypothetical protein